MKVFAAVLVVFTVLVTMVTSEQEKKKNEVSNIDILSILGKILQRLDVMDKNYKDLKKTVQANRDGTKEVRNEVKANREVLLKLDIHVRDQQMKLNDVTAITQEEQRDIAANAKSVKELSQAIDITLRNISKDVSEVKAVLTEVLPGKIEGKPAESCAWIKNRSYCARSGHFWIKDEGKPSLQFCNMDENKPGTTTVAPTTARQTTIARPTTTAHPTTTARPSTTTSRPSTTAPPTTQPIYRGASCKDLKNLYPHLMTGMYNITVGLSTFEVFCDMETDNGGWTMVGKAVVNEESEAKEVDYLKIQRDYFHQLHNVATGRFLLSTKGLISLYDTHKFTEFRFQCFKPYHGRHLDLKTTRIDVLEWNFERRSALPPSCGSFARLPKDRSFLGAHCEKWTDGKWWRRPMYNDPMAARDDGGLWHDVSLSYYYYKALFCDDYNDHSNFTNVGIWSFYIR